jgi:D-alanine-D-alanine ligase
MVSLLWPQIPQRTRILYLARFAPDDPVYVVKPDGVVSGYAEYHFNLYKALTEIGYSVTSSSKPYAAWTAGGNVDFVFSMLNRMPIRNPEVHIPSVCEYLRLPYLGAPPNIRALAEDKYLSKLAFQSLGLPVSPGRAYSRKQPLTPPPFAGPYFVKDRFGAASEGITQDSLQDTWNGAARIVSNLHDQGREVLVEAYCPGIDVTVPVIGHDPYLILGHVSPCSDKVGGILTQDLKEDDHLGNQLVDVGRTKDAMQNDVDALWQALGPIDYFRVDYRWDPKTGRRYVLEINICCYLGRGGALCLAAQEWGFSRADILAHVVEYSLARQKGAREQFRWVV